MAGVLPRTAVGVFHDRQEAEAAVTDLHRAGFRQDQIGVVARHEEAEEGSAGEKETKAAAGGVTGMVAGGTLGTLLGAVAAGLIPGVGPVLGAGILAAAVGGAATGAVAGGILGTLIGLSIPEEDARYYHGEFEAGRTLVTIKADGRYDEAVRILRTHGAYGKGSPLI
jgi:hypothetical protein